MKARKRQKQRRSMTVLLSLLLLFIAFSTWGAWFLHSTVEPALADLGRMRARSMVTRMVTEAINGQFHEEEDTEKLITRKNNAKGEMEMLQANTKAINLLITEIAKELQQEYQDMKPDIIRVPAGALLGSEIISQTGPKVDLEVLPLSVSSMDFKTEFETQGINQTKYKVYIILKSQVKVLAPFSSSTFDISSTVLIAEAVILGTVPQNYVEVPKEDILDVT